MKTTLLTALLGAAAALGAGAARGEEVPVCYNYGCSDLAVVSLDPAALAPIAALFAGADTAGEERAALALAMPRLYALAAAQTPIGRDRGGNIDDEMVDGRMDCIDHSTNTTTWLALAERRGWMKQHTTLGPIRRGRFIIDVHWTARVAERGSGAEWTIDTWFLDPGHPAAVYPVDEWLAGAHPPGAGNFRLR